MKQVGFKLIALAALLMIAGFGCQGVSKEAQQAMRPVTLTWWRVFDDPDAMGEIIGNYRAIHPNVSINYRKLRPEEYEQELVNALAEDRGPDIFSIHNTAMQKYQSKLTPLPRELKIPYLVVTGSIKKETKTELRTKKTIRIDQLKNRFVDQVAEDAILTHRADDGSTEERIFGLPLALDTMVLYWNRDLLNTARIPEPAKTWEEFLRHMSLLAKFGPNGEILQAGAAIGTGKNVERAGDLLSVIMMQNGTEMTRNGSVAFAANVADREVPPGLEALRFYTDFADKGKAAYTWNGTMPNSLEAFTAGTVAYFFGYSYHLPVIRSRAPKLNVGIAAIPQIDPLHEVNFANYWLEGVSAKTKKPDWAWDFLEFATSAEQAKTYLAKTKKPTALRSVIATQAEDLDLAVFAQAVLTAKNWYHGKDPAAAETALVNLIETVVAGTLKPEDALNVAAGQVAQTLR